MSYEWLLCPFIFIYSFLIASDTQRITTGILYLLAKYKNGDLKIVTFSIFHYTSLHILAVGSEKWYKNRKAIICDKLFINFINTILYYTKYRIGLVLGFITALWSVGLQAQVVFQRLKRKPQRDQNSTLTSWNQRKKLIRKSLDILEKQFPLQSIWPTESLGSGWEF